MLNLCWTNVEAKQCGQIFKNIIGGRVSGRGTPGLVRDQTFFEGGQETLSQVCVLHCVAKKIG